MSTMRDVAQRAGVSTKTVSRVVNNDRYISEDVISEDVRRRVEQAIADLQYVPNVLAQTLRSGKDKAIGIAVPDLADPFFAGIVRAVEQIARRRGRWRPPGDGTTATAPRSPRPQALRRHADRSSGQGLRRGHRRLVSASASVCGHAVSASYSHQIRSCCLPKCHWSIR
ncbi:MAG: LacI family transcriptional regulator [Dactylosporangium sp.]|nr:LacI family transcriptional regulator [Dactylosporangium sp.]